MGRKRYKETRFRLGKEKGKPNYYVKWTEASKPRKVSTGTENEAQAYAYLREFELNYNVVKGETENINKIIDRYLDKKEREMKEAGTHNRGGGFRNLENSFKTIREEFGSYLPTQLNPALIENYKEKYSHLASKTIRNYLTNFIAALNSAKKDGVLKGEICYISLPPNVKKNKKEVLNEAEINKALNMAEELHLKVFLNLAFFTAQRVVDITNLTWDRVDFDNRIINFIDNSIHTGNKRQVATPMVNEVYEVLQIAYEVAETDYVLERYGQPVKDVKKSFKSLMKKITTKNITPYCIKHSAITMLAKKGIPFWKISMLTGVDTRTLEKHYAQIHPEYIKGSMETLSELITASGKNYQLIKGGKKP